MLRCACGERGCAWSAGNGNKNELTPRELNNQRRTANEQQLTTIAVSSFSRELSTRQASRPKMSPSRRLHQVHRRAGLSETDLGRFQGTVHRLLVPRLGMSGPPRFPMNAKPSAGSFGWVKNRRPGPASGWAAGQASRARNWSALAPLDTLFTHPSSPQGVSARHTSGAPHAHHD